MQKNIDVDLFKEVNVTSESKKVNMKGYLDSFIRKGSNPVEGHQRQITIDKAVEDRNAVDREICHMI